MRSLALSAVVVAGGSLLLSCGGTQGASRPTKMMGGGGAGGSGGPNGTPDPVTTCAGTAATYPGFGALPAVASLPDPFTAMDGTRITAASQWTCRAAEIGGQAQNYELGPKPPKPASVTGAWSTNTDGGSASGGITVTVTDSGKTISFTATVTLPTTGKPPYPAMIGMDGINIGPATLNQMGVATIVFPSDKVAVQDSGSSRGLGAFYDMYGATHPAGAMIAWAWGVDRLIDALETTPAAQIDPARLGVTGCSRNGKGALIAGAFDSRIVLTIPQESGSGGAASWRISDWQVKNGWVDSAGKPTVQTLSEITGENVWFQTSFSQFASSSTKLPFDHHEIEGMVAPRALLIIENTDQIWLGSVSTYNNSMAAHEIWQALGVPDHMGVSQYGHPDHCGWDGVSQQPEVTAYVQKFLIGGGTGNTNVLKTDGDFTFDAATWAPWSVPNLTGATGAGGAGGNGGAGGLSAGGNGGAGGLSGAGGISSLPGHDAAVDMSIDSAS